MPRAYWKVYLHLPVVTCRIESFPATSESEKTYFHQNRLRPLSRAPVRSGSNSTRTARDRTGCSSGPFLITAVSLARLWHGQGNV
jgi:hypothetical protein